MANGFSQYQQSQLGVSAAKARAISEQSEAYFRTGLTAVQELEALKRAEDQLEKIAKEAERKARKRARRSSIGRLVGSIAGYALGGPLGGRAVGAALGGLAGTAAAGGFKRYGVEVPDSLVPGGVFYPRQRESISERAEDVEQAFKDLTRQQRQGIAKNLVTDYISGSKLGKLGETKVGDLDITLDELRALGKEGVIDYSGVDYLKDVFQTSLGGISDNRLSELTKLTQTNITPRQNLISAIGTDERLASIENALSPDVDVLNPLGDITDTLRDIKIQNIVQGSKGPTAAETTEALKAAVSLRPRVNQTAPALQQNRSIFDALNRERNVLMGSPNNLPEFVRNFGGGAKSSVLPVSNERMDYTAFFDDLVETGVMTNRQVDDLFDNPDSLANELDVLYGNRSRPSSTRNALFMSSVGPIRGAI